LLSESC